MPTQKSKPTAKSKPDKNKKPSELRDEELRSVSGGLASGAGVKIVDDDGCISRT